jgi:hypothetical protein
MVGEALLRMPVGTCKEEPRDCTERVFSIPWRESPKLLKEGFAVTRALHDGGVYQKDVAAEPGESQPCEPAYIAMCQQAMDE